MQERLAVAPFVTRRVAILCHEAFIRGMARRADAAAARTIEIDRRRTGGAMNGMQNENEVCLGIEAMHLRGRGAARTRTAGLQGPAATVMNKNGTQIAECWGLGGTAGAKHATARDIPVRELGFSGGLSIVRNTIFLNRVVMATEVAPLGDMGDTEAVALKECIGVPDIGAEEAGDALQVAGSFAIAQHATRHASRLADAHASAGGEAAAGRRARVVDLRPVRQAARSRRTASRQDERIEARANYLTFVSRRPFARRPAPDARIGTGMREAAGGDAGKPNDFREARISVLDVVKK